MTDQFAGPAPTTAFPEAPPGHSRSAHRVHGRCAHCKGYSAADEAVAWRVWAAELQARQDAAAEAGGERPGITASADPARRCPQCRELMLTVVRVRVLTDTGPRVAGGWAYCFGCDATPHPLMAEVAGG